MRRIAVVAIAATTVGVWSLVPAAVAEGHRTKTHRKVYLAEERGSVSTTAESPVELGGPTLRIWIPRHARVKFFVSFEGQTALSTDGVDRAGVFAEVVDPIDFPAGTLPDVGMTPPDSAFHRYTTTNAGGGVEEYPATPGWHSYTLEYSEVPTLCVGGSCGTFPPAFFRDRRLTVTVIWTERHRER